MFPLVLGVGAAFAASTFYNLGVALQALDARTTPAERGMRPSLLSTLLRRPRWVAGTLLGVVGWPLQAAALVLAPLTVVQPALGFGFAVLLAVGACVLHERVGAREIGSVGAIVAGVAVLALAAPATAAGGAGAGATAAVLAAIAAMALAPFLVASAPFRGGVGATGLLAALGAGAAFAWSGLSTKEVADALVQGTWPAALAWAVATGLASGLALISEMTALQRRQVTHVAPLVFAVQVVLPVMAAPLLADERWTRSAARAAAVCAGLALVVAGSALLAVSPTVSAAMGAEPRAARRR